MAIRRTPSKPKARKPVAEVDVDMNDVHEEGVGSSLEDEVAKARALIARVEGTGAGGVFPGGTGAAVSGNALGRNTELNMPIGRGGSVARHVDLLNTAQTQKACSQCGGGIGDL